MPEFIDIDPGTLRLPPSRASGADPGKLHRQIAQYRNSAVGMPPIWVYRGTDGSLMIFDGVTRATRIAKLRPAERVTVEVIGRLPAPCGHLPTVGERLP